MRARKKFMAAGKAFGLCSDLLLALKGEHFVSSGFSTEGYLNFCSRGIPLQGIM